MQCNTNPNTILQRMNLKEIYKNYSTSSEQLFLIRKLHFYEYAIKVNFE